MLECYCTRFICTRLIFNWVIGSPNADDIGVWINRFSYLWASWDKFKLAHATISYVHNKAQTPCGLGFFYCRDE